MDVTDDYYSEMLEVVKKATEFRLLQPKGFLKWEYPKGALG